MDIHELIRRFNARVATRAERDKLLRLLQTGEYDDIIGNALYRQLLEELETFDPEKLTDAERHAAQPVYEQSRARLIDHMRNTSSPAEQRPAVSRPNVMLWPWLVAAALTIIIGITLFLYVQQPSAASPVAMQINVTAQTYKGKQFIHLPDGSTVILNAGSELRYDSAFGKATRDVTLTGEAFFDIQHDAAKPFRVWSGNVYTYVLGTAFNVKAYPEQTDIVVTVARGKVKVCDEAHELGVVMPKQQLAVQRTTLQAEPIVTPDADALAWKDDFLIFDNVAMADAVSAIGRKFGVTVQVTDGVRDCHINAAFLNNESLEHILTVVSKVLHGEYVQEGNTVTINGSCR